MKIARIDVKNFKSFSDEVLEIKDFTILIGANASGKSNTISLIRSVLKLISLTSDIDYLKLFTDSLIELQRLMNKRISVLIEIAKEIKNLVQIN